ncbi:hypothetical protein K504DRAFT_383722 [Pleomassaria siparia CBS 279.74]|uniref:Uncharacterized protein n=1 Tax=Pleomassaria siparia CBS 279.74 TaxID=1314801 RepID=A0A6G1K3C2_9PLEO|nr:hypothetical protein K504DRAFT_383722 [Pleomassaria siparia CBS 279.74]
MADTPQPSVFELATLLSDGFAALSDEYQLLFDQQRQLETKLSWAKQQYLDLLKRFTPDTLSQDHRIFLQDLERVAAESPQPHPQPEWVDRLAESEDDERRKRASIIRQVASISTGIRTSPDDDGVKIWSGPSADKEKPPLRIKTTSDMSQMERDFTTAGMPSKLGCPFAPRSGRQSPLVTPRSSTSRMSLRGRRSKRPSFNDPIRAEICGNDQASASASVDGSAAVCPIRFLDQHAPEEVAKYFEKHKHELPRSHEVCINRFQSNAESIEQLDRKYGNLVSMIQGLGAKHQAWLPEDPDEAVDEPLNETQADELVHNWAKAVSTSLRDPSTPDEESQPPESGVDFDRPLKEIRVGESPSRPWGVTIPAKYTNGESSSSVGSAPTASPPLPIKTEDVIEKTPQKSGKCPFDHGALGRTPDIKQTQQNGPSSTHDEEPSHRPPHLEPRIVPETTEHDKTDHDVPKTVPQMVFNGPVFIGYPPDQLMALLKNSNLGAAMQ